jgi:hypothetical protein
MKGKRQEIRTLQAGEKLISLWENFPTLSFHRDIRTTMDSLVVQHSMKTLIPTDIVYTLVPRTGSKSFIWTNLSFLEFDISQLVFSPPMQMDLTISIDGIENIYRFPGLGTTEYLKHCIFQPVEPCNLTCKLTERIST